MNWLGYRSVREKGARRDKVASGSSVQDNQRDQADADLRGKCRVIALTPFAHYIAWVKIVGRARTEFPGFFYWTTSLEGRSSF
jgi:hypothetical protein